MIDRARVLLVGVLLMAFAPVLRSAALSPKAELRRSLATLVESMYPDARSGATVLVARDSSIVYRAARGQADVARHVAMKIGAPLRIGSMTKQLVAVAVLMLAESGRLSLDDPLSRFIPDYPNGAQIPIRTLLNHTSGIKSYTELSEVLAGPIWHEATTRQVIASFSHAPPNFAPSQGFAYSNSNYILLGAVIESKTGMPWHEYVRRALLEPLGMSHTGFVVNAAQKTFAKGHSTEDDTVVPAAPIGMNWAGAAAGLFSTVDDLLIWNRALHGGRILGPGAYRMMTSPSGKAATGHYGFGVAIEDIGGHRGYGHSGALNGFASCMVFVPDTRVTVVILENNDGGEKGNGPCALVHKLAAIASFQ